MVTLYRVVTLREDDSVVGWDGPFRSPGLAKATLRTVSKGLGPNNPSGAVKAEIQTLIGEWKRPVESDWADSGITFDTVGYVALDNPPTDPAAIAAGLTRNMRARKGKQFPLT